jgi:hypothetical protein
MQMNQSAVLSSWSKLNWSKFICTHVFSHTQISFVQTSPKVGRPDADEPAVQSSSAVVFLSFPSSLNEFQSWFLPQLFLTPNTIYWIQWPNLNSLVTIPSLTGLIYDKPRDSWKPAHTQHRLILRIIWFWVLLERALLLRRSLVFLLYTPLAFLFLLLAL